MYKDDPVLECDQCGEEIRKLTAAETQRIKHHPYEFIVLCDCCKRERTSS